MTSFCYQLAELKASLSAAEASLKAVQDEKTSALDRASTAEDNHATAKKEIERLMGLLAAAELLQKTLNGDKEGLGKTIAELQGSAEKLASEVCDMRSEVDLKTDWIAYHIVTTLARGAHRLSHGSR